MKFLKRRLLVSTVAIVATVMTLALPASAHGHDRPPKPPVQVVASGLNGPSAINFGEHHLYVAETDIGQITRIDTHTGAKRAVVTGLQFPTGVDKVGEQLAITTGGSDVPDAPTAGTASVFLAHPGHQPKLLADLLAYELAHNPDGQLQFDPTTHQPLDSLSNPFALLTQRSGHGVFVADAGGNVVYSVSLSGHVKVFFLPPVVTTGACAGAPNNDPQHTGCDPVPTGLAYGPHDTLYVSTLSGEAPGEGRVYVLDAHSGHVRRVITGLDAPTGVVVDHHGTVYVSEVIFGAPEGEGPPPADFDPSTVGRIVRISRHGHRTYAQVTMPIGLAIHDGKLYSSAWSVAGQFLGTPNAGQIVTVSERAFHSAT
jgi:hypothetical protein